MGVTRMSGQILIKPKWSADAFWGGSRRLLFAPAVFLLPGLPLVAMGGPFVSRLMGVLEGAFIVGVRWYPTDCRSSGFTPLRLPAAVGRTPS